MGDNLGDKMELDDFNLSAEQLSNTDYPLSSGQRGLWFLHQLDPLSDRYNMPLTFRFSNRVSVDELNGIIEVFIKRHSLLRSTFYEVDGIPFRRVRGEAKFSLSEQDVSAFSFRELCKEVRVLSQVPFDLENGPLIRVSILNGYRGKPILLITFHHLIFDGASLDLLFVELEQIYQNLAQSDISLPPIPHDFQAFVSWQENWLKSDEAKASKEFWLEQLSGELPAIDFPLRSAQEGDKPIRGEVKSFMIPNEVVESFRKQARQHRCSEYFVWLMAYFAFLFRYTSQTDVIVGTPSRGRPEADFDNIIGYFVNLIPVRCNVKEEESFGQLMRRFKDKLYESLFNADYPLAELVSMLGLVDQRGHEPLFQTSFIWTPIERLKLKQNSLLELEVFPLVHQSGEQLLSFEFFASKDSIEGFIKYRTNDFSEQTISRMEKSFLNFISNIAHSPDRTLSELSLLGADEQHYLLHTLNDIQLDHPNGLCIHELFEAQVENVPAHVALVYEDKVLDYKELNEASNRLANYLIKHGVVAETLVGLCVERSLETVIGILGILKAGGAYVPLDPGNPVTRIQYVLEDSGLKYLLTQSELTRKLDLSQEIKVIELDGENYLQQVNKFSANNLGRGHLQQTSNLAYVIYTSGSTGMPKGVLQTHKNVARLFSATEPEFGFSVEDTWILFHSIAFDFSVWELWGALIYGGKLVIPSYECICDTQQFVQLCHAQQVSVLNQTPRAFQVFSEVAIQQDVIFNWLRFIVFGGDVLQVSNLLPWWDHYGEKKPHLVNMYGITETTVHVTLKHLNREDVGLSLIGRHLRDQSIYLLDTNKKLVPIGIVGEIYVGGAGLARGYLNNPKLTKERFIRNPFNDVEDKRLYRTGDLARYHSDGELEFIGRTDQQVKIRGFRIELGEIEHHLSKLSDIRSSAVITHEDMEGEKRLVAYLSCDSILDEDEFVAGIRNNLQSVLPDFMIPSKFVVLDELPLSPNGKIDRETLPEPDIGKSGISFGYVAPTGDVEKELTTIWAKVLKQPIDKISATDNFFELGGHSLLVVSLINEVMNSFKLEMNYREIFDRPTLRNLSQSIEILIKKEDLIQSLIDTDSSSIEEIEW